MVPIYAVAVALNSRVRRVTSPDVHGRPLFAKPSFRNGLKVKIAPVHSDFCCETCSLSLMGSAGQRLNRLHALEVPRPARVMPTTVLPVLPSLS